MSNHKYSYAAVYRKSWKATLVALILVALASVIACGIWQGIVGVESALIGIAIAAVILLVTFLVQNLVGKNFDLAMAFIGVGFILKLVLMIAALSAVRYFIPEQRMAVILVLMVAVFVTFAVEARVLGTRRVMIIEDE